MEVNGTLINYYFHCRRQCYLFGNRLNLEDNSELVQIGKAIHEEMAGRREGSEIAIENIKIDRLNGEFLTEIKKSDADLEACQWQLYFYLKKLKEKGIIRKGKLEFAEKKRDAALPKESRILELTEEKERELEAHIQGIRKLLLEKNPPPVLPGAKCKKCAYFEYCGI